MSALIPCRDDDGLGAPMAPVVCSWCNRNMGAKVCAPDQAGKITHSVCPGCRAGLERETSLVTGECLEGRGPQLGCGAVAADAGSLAPSPSPASPGAGVAAAAPAGGTLPGRVNGTSTPADEAAVLEHLSGGPAAASVTSFGARPLWSCVTGADFGRSFKWAKSWVNPLAVHVAAAKAALPACAPGGASARPAGGAR
jgi:hypothetical protein